MKMMIGSLDIIDILENAPFFTLNFGVFFRVSSFVNTVDTINIIIQSDNLKVVKAIQRSIPTILTLAWIRRIRNILSKEEQWTLRYISRSKLSLFIFMIITRIKFKEYNNQYGSGAFVHKLLSVSLFIFLLTTLKFGNRFLRNQNISILDVRLIFLRL